MKNYVSVIFEQNAPMSDRVAVVDRGGERQTSWKELYRRSCAVAEYASAMGLRGLVPVFMARCVETVEVLLGLSLAGLGVAPLSDHTPAARVAQIEEQSGNAAWTMADYEKAMSCPGNPFAPVAFSAEDPAYVVFTSGSTGVPKGVMLSDRVVEMSYRRMASAEFLELDKNSVVLQHASFSFVALMIDLYAPLFTGCTVHILPEEARSDMNQMTAYINAHGITSTFITPKPLRRLGDAPSLKVLVVGGERVSDLGPKNYKLKNVWGMSETAALALGYSISEPMSVTPIGKSCGDFRCYILDEEGKPAGEGELCLSGAIATGYYKRPDLTKEAFVSNPFCDEEGHRVLMHTGDLVRRLPDGNLLFISRKDYMVKINGQRVEPGEAEAVLEKMEGISACAVKSFTEEDGHSYLCAYYVSENGPDETAIRAELERQLPSYMVPGFYVKLDALPLNANRKVDRKSLPAPEIRQGEYIAPETSTEAALCKAFEKALRVGRVGVEEDFFRLGGDSIRAMEVVSLAALPGLTPGAVLSGRTPRRIAAMAAPAASGTEAVSTDAAPLTDSQLGIYLECAASPDSVKYNIPFTVTFPRAPGMTTASVAAAVDSVLAVHPALYARVAPRGEEVLMIRHSMPEDGLCEAVELAQEDIPAAAAGFVRPFRPAEEPLCRAKALLTPQSVCLLMDTHHMVSDGSSVAILVRQLTEALTGTAPCGESEDAFALYAAQQKRKETDGDRAAAHFASLLSGVEVDSNLLPDFTGNDSDPDAGRLSVRLDGLDFAGIRERGLTVSTFFMTVFGYTLAKMTGLPEALFAVAESGRKSAGLRDTVSMIVRTLPAYLKLAPEKTPSDLMREMQAQFYASMEHDCVSFSDLAREYGVSADVMFVYQSDMLSDRETALGHTAIEMIPTGKAISNFNVSVFRQGDGHIVNLEYRTDRYTGETAERFAEVFRNAAKAFASDASLAAIPLLSEKDRLFLDGMNRTESPFRTDETVVDLFRRRVAEHPDKPAVICEDRVVSYARADEITDRIAAFVAAQGIGRGQTVSVLINRSEYMLLTALGVMKAGAMYQPLDPSYPSERLTFMRQDADSALLIADRSLMHMLPGFSGRALYLDEIPALPAAAAPVAQPGPEDGYILLYTSGTTGTPKGCMLAHRNLTAFVHAYSALTDTDGDSVAAAYASFGFDACMADMYPVISNGGTLVIVPDAIRFDLPAVKEYIDEHCVTHMIMTTQLCQQFVSSYRTMKHLRALVAGGEKMASIEPPKTYRLINGYGPTECTVCETAFTVNGEDEDIPIGKAMNNTRLYVVDTENRRVPVGVPGELIISGPQVAPGYLNRPEQTAKAFVPNAFEENVPAEYRACYRTGDIVRFRADGNLVFIGRRDQQVKIRGFRIELSEVESVILEYPGIKAATVAARDAAAGGKCLHAFIVSDEKVDIAALNDFIRGLKPPYMVPAATMQLESLPLTANGKVDKRRLPQMEQHFEDAARPENELQERLFRHVAKVLGTEAFGIRTDLFEAGLSSIGSIRLCTLLGEEFGIPVQLRTLKKYSTVEKLEGFVKASLEPEAAPARMGNESPAEASYSEDHPISKTMESIFSECFGKPNSTFYNIPCLMKLSAGVDEDRLRRAIASAVEAHPTMKAELFTDAEGRIRWHRRLKDAYTPDCVGLLTAARIEDLKTELVKPFAITGGPLFAISLIHADGLYLFMNFHHVIADGTAISVLLCDIERAYAGEALSGESYNAFDVAEDEQRARTEEELSSAKAYYENLLEDLDRSALPMPDRLESMDKSSGRYAGIRTGVDLEAVRSFCGKHRVSLNAFFVSAFGFVLSRFAGADSAVFTTVYNGRNDSRTENTFGMLVKTLPAVFRMDRETSTDAVRAMASQLMDSMMADIFSYGEVVRTLGMNSDVMFVFQGEGFERTEFCGAPVEEIALPLSEAKAPLALQVMLKNGQVVYDLEYDPQRFSAALMESLLSALDMACMGFAAGKPLKAISLLSPDAEAEMERQNRTEFPYDQTQTITGMFLKRCAETPDKLCVAYKQQRITYRDAQRLTGKIARCLMERGIGFGDAVPILIHRTEAMVITAHGVVRAGAAYIGLDPTYPSDRLEFMISDSGAKLLIADRALMGSVPGYQGDVLYLDEIEALPELTPELEQSFRENERFRLTPENDALIVYSSGTTGLPKGSVLQHKAIVCFFYNYTLDMEMNPASNVAAYASFGFDGGAMDVFCVPMVGAALFVIPDEIRMDIAALEAFYARNAITNGFMTTQVATMFVSRTKCRSLRHFTCGGEKLIPVIAPEWVAFDNGYGPSETMCYVNKYRVKDTAALQPIGRVNRNLKEYVLDSAGNRLPFGACGELCISGGQLGRGYLNRPEKTAEVFVKNPFCTLPGYDRMYRTGDVVRLLPDGNYDFVGRRDGQVKIRGFRVELSEVESQIRKFPGITKTVVTAYDNPAGGKYLAAYVTSTGKVDIDGLKAFIAAEKPEYMVPAVIMPIAEIPLTSNGKVDLRKLPKAELRPEGKGAEPADETEEKICNIFRDVLGLKKVYADDDFFAIGGSSISAIQVIVKCEQAGMNVVYKNLFANPTAQKLTSFLYGGKEKDIIASDLEKGDGHDYSALKYNVVENLPGIRSRGVGDVLLTGVTGFLGSHVFRELLDSTGGKVICLVRSKDGMPAQDRLEMMMVYYFEDWYTPELSSRVTVIDAELEDDTLSGKLEGLSFDTILNCAANVKHFAEGNALIGANFTGVENLIALAEERDAALVQISSLSVCGESVDGSVPEGYRFRETDLNIGQSLENKYIYSKYLAEQAVIDAVSRKRIRGKVIRLGNLMARTSDSEFQINAGTSGFLRLFIGFSELGCFPINLMSSEIEFSPIDSVAKAVVLLSGTQDEFTVFHAKNCNVIQFGYFLSAVSRSGRSIELVEDDEFERRLEKALEDETRVSKLGGLLAYRNGVDETMEDATKFYNKDDNGKARRVKIASDTAFTTMALYRLGFAWPLISEEYLNRMVCALKDMNYFSAD